MSWCCWTPGTPCCWARRPSCAGSSAPWACWSLGGGSCALRTASVLLSTSLRPAWSGSTRALPRPGATPTRGGSLARPRPCGPSSAASCTGPRAAASPRTATTSSACRPSSSPAPSRAAAASRWCWTRIAASSSAWESRSAGGTTSPHRLQRAAAGQQWPRASGIGPRASGPSWRTAVVATADGSWQMSTGSSSCWTTSACARLTCKA
mmetsp:Transcript_28467/g.90719  ORF Transcript_28467/g.90719 Transcript_28467/m.90719 type:complete len:208 (-) Transcript_28467:239-862(-)